jgi:hypothetical protein
MSALRLVPVDWKTARGFCRSWHRHHPKPPPGYKWAHGVANDLDVLVGIAIVGRPVARHFDDGLTVEVNRTVTDGSANANSMLYGAVARAAFALGYRRVVTYTEAASRERRYGQLAMSWWRNVLHAKDGMRRRVRAMRAAI